MVAFDAYLDARRIGKVTEGFRRLALGELCAIEIDPHLDATIGGACKRLHDGQVGQHICGQVDFMLGAIDQGDVDVFEVFGRRVMNDRRWIGGAWCQRGEEGDCNQGGAKQVQRSDSRP